MSSDPYFQWSFFPLNTVLVKAIFRINSSDFFKILCWKLVKTSQLKVGAIVWSDIHALDRISEFRFWSRPNTCRVATVCAN